MITHSWRMIRVLLGIGLLVVTCGSALSQESSARDALARFCELDAQGEQLTPDGWRKVSALFVAPGTPRRDEITIIRDYVVSRPLLEKGKAEFYVEYIELGRIDLSKMRFLSPLPAGIKVRAGFYVTNHPLFGAGGPSREPAAWRIEGKVPDPHLTVDAAIRYVTQLRANVTTTPIRRNAEKTLVTLMRLR